MSMVDMSTGKSPIMALGTGHGKLLPIFFFTLTVFVVHFR